MKRTNKEQIHAPDGSFAMKLGTTTYAVGIHFSKKCDITLEDELKKLLAGYVKTQCLTFMDCQTGKG